MKILQITMMVTLVALSSCKKGNEAFIGNSDIRVINTAIATSIKVDPGRNVDYARETQISYGGNRVYLLERTPSTFKVVNALDNVIKFYDATIDFSSNLYTMFIVGQNNTVETILKKETDFPFIDFINKIPVKADSVVNLRFINLSPNSVPVKIKIANTTGSEIDNLPYKTIGNWRKYAATATSTVYTFQIRDATTDALLSSFNFTANATSRFKNVSLIIKGLQGTTTGANAFGMFAVNHF